MQFPVQFSSIFLKWRSSECEAEDVVFSETFALKTKSDFVARDFHLASGSTWNYKLKVHDMAPVRLLMYKNADHE